jgi:hypothetical protein
MFPPLYARVDDTFAQSRSRRRTYILFVTIVEGKRGILYLVAVERSMHDEYEQRVSDRLARLEHLELVTRQDIAHTQQELVRMTADIELEMEALRKDLGTLDGEMHKSVDEVKFIVGKFKTVVKKGDLQRLQNRIDMWAPQDKITREQFKKLLE